MRGCYGRWEVVVDNIAEAREAATQGRRRLVEMTKKARVRPEFKAEEVKKLVVAYQHEIDALTKRSNACESAFTEIYGLFEELEDPSEALKATSKLSQALDKSEVEVRALQKELDTHQTTAADMKQLRIQLRKSEDKTRDLEAQKEKLLAQGDERNAQQEAKDRQQQHALLQRFAEGEQHMIGRMQEMEEKLKEEKHQRELSENQVFAMQTR